MSYERHIATLPHYSCRTRAMNSVPQTKSESMRKTNQIQTHGKTNDTQGKGGWEFNITYLHFQPNNLGIFSLSKKKKKKNLGINVVKQQPVYIDVCALLYCIFIVFFASHIRTDGRLHLVEKAQIIGEMLEYESTTLSMPRILC